MFLLTCNIFIIVILKWMNKDLKHLLVLVSNRVNTDMYNPQKQNSTKFKNQKRFEH